MTLAMGRHVHLRAAVAAPLTLRDLAHALPQALAMLTGKRADPMPGPTPGDGQTPTEPQGLRSPHRPWWENLGVEKPPCP